MTINGNLAQEIVDLMSESTLFNDLSFVIAYENEIKPTPLTYPIIAVSVKNCEIGEKISEVLDNGVISRTSSRNMDTALSIDIYLPYSKGGSIGHKIFDRIATFLLFHRRYNITKAVCYNAEHDSSCQAIILRTYFVFNNLISE